MKRYTVLLVLSFVLILTVITGTWYISGYNVNQSSTEKLQGEVTVYTTLPTENLTSLATEYERINKVRINFVLLTEEDLLERIQDTGKADLILADSRLLRRIAGEGWLVPHVSETGDGVSNSFKDPENYWIGVWYDPVVFCINRDYMNSTSKIPRSWQDVAYGTGFNIGITDFLAADSAANIYFFLVAQFGETKAQEMMYSMQPQIVQYAKYLSTPVRMAGMGEVDLSVTVQSEVLRYIDEGYPLKIIQPEEGTAYTLVGTGMLLKAPHEENARAFADWLLTDEAQLVLQNNKFYFMSTNPATLAYKKMPGRNIILFDQLADFSPEAKRQLLDNWVKNVRIR